MRRVITAALTAAVLLCTGAAWAAGPARAEATPIPAPTGPHMVGRAEAILTAGTRSIPVSVWYPTTTAGVAPYIPASSPAARVQLAGQAALWLHTPTAAPAMTAAVLPVAEGAPVADDGLPVVIWSPALGTPRWLASGLQMDLASRGYVVVAIDHTGESPAVEVSGRVQAGSPPDAGDTAFMQRAFDMRLADARLVLDRLATLPVVGSRADLGRVAMAGHSYGGQTTVSAMAADPRIRTGVVLDGPAVWDGTSAAPDVDRPVLLLASGATLHASWASTRATIATIADAGHYTGTDLPAFGCGVELCGTIDPTRGATITRSVVSAWLDEQLLNADSVMPDDPKLRWRVR
ncbi:alpha/beta hydrolase [Nocardia sp. NPDC050793]|uniref:alpha/beta hydrolase family protein n=1 Tax=Nocardia sp. NPDC050793 TaxID=3155159 RepID=UPI0033D715EC